MIKVFEEKGKRFWCHSCFKKYKKDEVRLFNISVKMPGPGDVEVANFRLWQQCLGELNSQTKKFSRKELKGDV